MAKRSLGTHFLKQWREFRGLSLRKLAAKMEIEPGVELTSHANIGRIENFQQSYSQEIMEAAAEVFGCSVAEILTVDPTGHNSREIRLRSALTAYGIHEKLVDAAILAVQGFRADSRAAEQSQPLHPPAETASANRRREKAPTR